VHTSHTPPKHNPGERENDREVCCRTATAIPMSAQNDDEFSLDPTAPRAQPGPDERQSHGGSSPPQPHSSSSSSVTVSRQAPEAMHVGIRPQGMPGFHPAASSASYYPGAVFAGLSRRFFKKRRAQQMTTTRLTDCCHSSADSCSSHGSMPTTTARQHTAHSHHQPIPHRIFLGCEGPLLLAYW